jgi:4,5-DOPA dioxygenase extradiol
MLNNLLKYGENTERMPVVFVGHGSPMNAIEDNEFSRTWQQLQKDISRPKAILCVSAHWKPTVLTSQPWNIRQRFTISEVIPLELYNIQYRLQQP